MIRLAAAFCLALATTHVDAQEARKQARVGFLSVATDRTFATYVPSFKRFAERGWVEGRNLVVDWRNARGDMAALERHAADLVKLKSDVIVTIGAEAPLKAARLGLPLTTIELGNPFDLQGVFRSATQARADALLLLMTPLFLARIEEINDAAVRARLPSISGNSYYADKGGLFSYGPSFEAMFVLMADQVDRILRGARPADLPVLQPTTFSFVVNLRTAKSIGVKLPQATLSRVDRVVE